jgi:hypothetical protein
MTVRWVAETRVCNDCAAPYVWSAGEQQYFERRGFPPPKRCPDCRAVRKQLRDTRETAQADRANPAGRRPRRHRREAAGDAVPR